MQINQWTKEFTVMKNAQFKATADSCKIFFCQKFILPKVEKLLQ